MKLLQLTKNYRESNGKVMTFSVGWKMEFPYKQSFYCTSSLRPLLAYGLNNCYILPQAYFVFKKG